MGDGTRTRGHRGHNPVLYLLSYAHHGNAGILVVGGGEEQGEEQTRERIQKPESKSQKTFQTWNMKVETWSLEPLT